MAPHEVKGYDNPAGTDTNGVAVGNGVRAKNESHEDETSCGRKITNAINGSLERGFGRLGFFVASHPWKVIAVSIAIVGLSLIGILEYEVENRGEKNWVSQSSDALKHKDWVAERFPSEFRRVDVMLEATSGNILTAQGLTTLYNLHMRVLGVSNGTVAIQWEDICYRTSGVCIPMSILEVWSYNLTVISKLTEPEILQEVNKKKLRSPMTGKLVNVKLLIGGPVQENANGTEILRAKVAKIQFRIKKNTTFDSGKGKEVDKNGEAFEKAFDKEMVKYSAAGFKLYYLSEWGRGEASGNAAGDDLQFLALGYVLVIIYLAFMLGSFSRLGHKVYLALAGIVVIGMSVGAAYGLGSAFQMKKTAVHDVLAFLLLGIGVDDVFVIIQTWDNIGGGIPDGRSIQEKVSTTLSTAGVSILVTSITDVCAFAIGASTILPALQSFCIWCAVGILFVFLLTITFFTACLTIDAKRQETRRDACCCCIRLDDDWEPTECSKKSYLQLVLKNYYAPALMSIPGKIIALLTVAGLLAGGAVGLSELKQNFDFNWFLPPSSAPRQYTENVDIFFPSSGVLSAAYTGTMNYYEDRETFSTISNRLAKDKYISRGSVENWYEQYHVWLNTTHPNEVIVDAPCLTTITACKTVNESRFFHMLHLYLQSSGKFFANFISFDKNNNAKIVASYIRFQHIVLEDSAVEIKAMDSVQAEIKPGLSKSEKEKLLPFAYSREYVGWETNKIITKELFRNILLAVACVFLVTLFLLSHLWTALLVVICVVLALVDIAGFMSFWGLTIDTVTTIIMVLAIGLTVDYSAHIAHGFMVSRKPTKNERMIDALEDIGPAVIHGGMSTFLAFILLSASKSYVFETFFKVFFLVVVFGIFHGLVFLPVILSLLGPRPYADHNAGSSQNGQQMKEMNKNKQMPSDEPVQLEKMKKTDDTFVVKESGTNMAYVGDQ